MEMVSYNIGGLLVTYCFPKLEVGKQWDHHIAYENHKVAQYKRIKENSPGKMVKTAVVFSNSYDNKSRKKRGYHKYGAFYYPVQVVFAYKIVNFPD